MLKAVGRHGQAKPGGFGALHSTASAVEKGPCTSEAQVRQLRAFGKKADSQLSPHSSALLRFRESPARHLRAPFVRCEALEPL